MGGDKGGSCSDQVPFFTSVGLIDTRPAFVALLIGMVISLLIFIAEHSKTIMSKLKSINHVRPGFEGRFWSFGRERDDVFVYRDTLGPLATKIKKRS